MPVFLLLLACSGEPDHVAQLDLSTYFPDTLGSFAAIQPLQIIKADSLEYYIGEIAEDFRKYNVQQLGVAKYGLGNLLFSVSLYEFNDRLGAFGIYSKNRMPNDNYIDLGCESLLGSSYLYYFKDRYFMAVNSLSSGLPDFESIYGFARSIDSLIPGSALYPEQLMVFPEKRLISHSEKFFIDGPGISPGIMGCRCLLEWCLFL